jgi:N-acyl-L-homoserine lactone synthetase
MLDDRIPALPGVFENPLPAASASGLLRIEGARTLLRYRTYFRAEDAASDDLLKTALSLRYQVYCVERNFLDGQRHPDRLESDTFDTHSVHGVLFYRPWNRPVGTSRLILPDDGRAPFPFYAMLDKAGMALTSHFPRGRTAEISRFAVSRAFRPDKTMRSKMPCLGLAQLLLRLSRTHEVTHWVAVMPNSLLRMLAMMGIEFTPVGEAVSYHGVRQPAVCEIAQLLDTLYRRFPAHWQIMTDGGRLAET